MLRTLAIALLVLGIGATLPTASADPLNHETPEPDIRPTIGLLEDAKRWAKQIIEHPPIECKGGEPPPCQ